MFDGGISFGSIGLDGVDGCNFVVLEALEDYLDRKDYLTIE